MDDRLRPELESEPGIEGKIAVRRDEIGIVIAARWIDVVAARRLHGDDKMAETMDRKNEPAVGKERIRLRAAPSRPLCLAQRRWQRRSEDLIVGEREDFAARLVASAVCRAR